MDERKRKRKYEKRLEERLASKRSKEFLVGKLHEEWQMLENESRKRHQRERIINLTKTTGKAIGIAILAATALAGTVVIAAVAPNVISVFSRSGRYRRYYDRQRVRRQLWYMEENGYIRTSRPKNDDGGWKGDRVRLTGLGEKKMLRDVLGGLRLSRQKKWDGTWRMVIFDIPDRHKWGRDAFRIRLKTMGFYPLQESVFIFPFPCQKEVSFLTFLFSVSGYVHFVETSSVSNDATIRKYFEL